MPDPNDLSSYEFQENPYLSMIQGRPSGGQPQGGMQGGMMGQQGQGGQMPGGMGGEEMEMPEDQMNPDQNPDSTKFLMGAISSIEKYIAKSTDRDEIATARSIVMLLGRLIQQDQENMAKQLPQ